MILRLRQPDRFSYDIFIRDVSSPTCLPHIPQPQLSVHTYGSQHSMCPSKSYSNLWRFHMVSLDRFKDFFLQETMILPLKSLNMRLSGFNFPFNQSKDVTLIQAATRCCRDFQRLWHLRRSWPHHHHGSLRYKLAPRFVSEVGYNSNN